jgi:hypothetical protein
MSRTTRGEREMMLKACGIGQSFDAAAGEPVGAFSRLVGVRGGADADELPLPERRESSVRSTSGMFTLTRMEAP